MQTAGFHHAFAHSTLLGNHRGVTDGARFALDLACPKAETDSSARVGAYPSPPMSGSPLSQKAASEASERPQLSTGYPTTVPQDVYRGTSTRPSPTESQPSQGYLPAQDPFLRSHPHEMPERMAHGYQQGGEYPPRPISYPPQSLPSVSQAIPSQPYLASTASQSTPGFPVTNRPPNMDNQSFSTSPKSQRKAKGHVASACVPCKRAHLRCDAQRPCSRCRSNGKEDACVDVQHKKRGRPRLRDDRDARYDMSRPPAAQEAARRPLSIYPGYDPSQQPPQHFRALKPNSSEPIAPRYMDRGRDSGAYGPPLSLTTTQQPPEPAAYLTLDLEIAKASETFIDALGGLMNRRTLEDVVVPSEREKVSGLRNMILQEQKQREPNYLPPIMGRGEHVLQGLGFSVGEISRFQLDVQEYLTFTTAEGQPRVYPVRLGLQKDGSFYFVVLVLAIQRAAYPISPHERSGPPGAYNQPPTHAYPPPPPGSMSHDLSRHRLSEGIPSQRPTQPLPPGAPVQSPGFSPIGHHPPHSYLASSRGPEYPGAPAYQTPRSEMSSSSQSQGPPRPSSYQLPPIRPPPERDESSSESGGRLSRVDIEGLIEKPEGPGRMH